MSASPRHSRSSEDRLAVSVQRGAAIFLPTTARKATAVAAGKSKSQRTYARFRSATARILPTVCHRKESVSAWSPARRSRQVLFLYSCSTPRVSPLTVSTHVTRGEMRSTLRNVHRAQVALLSLGEYETDANSRMRSSAD